MKTYVDYSHWSNEFQIDATLTLEDNGSFSYSEDWHCYGAGFLRSAGGSWRQEGDTIFLHCDDSEDGMFLTWFTGGEKQAVDLKDSICIDGHFEMSLVSDDSASNAEPTKNGKATESDVEEKKNEPPQIIAKLHFKDGRILERRLPKNLPDTLFTQTFYRLVDEVSDQTYVFKSRPDSANSESQLVDYDEISTGKNPV